MGSEIWILPLVDCAENFAVARNIVELVHRTIAELRDMDPWETELFFWVLFSFMCLTGAHNIAELPHNTRLSSSVLFNFIFPGSASMLHTFTF